MFDKCSYLVICIVVLIVYATFTRLHSRFEQDLGSMAIAAKNEDAELTHGKDDVPIQDLHNKLDDVWSQYLEHLETYQTAQITLQEQLSTAFFSLAQANFTKVSGRRYGRDYYDQRAIASVRVHVKQATTGRIEQYGSDSSDRWAIVQKRAATKDADSLSRDVRNLKLENEPETQPVGSKDARRSSDEDSQTPGATELPPLEKAIEADSPEQATKSGKNDHHAPPSDSPQDEGIPEQDPTDPLRSLAGGILIPLQLRKTRDAFASLFKSSDAPGVGSTECSIVQAVVAARRMREIEADIRRIRKAIRKAEKDPEGK
jgi:hypothetical protein